MRTSVLVGSAALALALTGCSSQAHDTAATKSATATKAPDSAAKVVQNQLPDPAKLVNDVKKRKQIQLSKCSASDGGWQAQGTATNKSGQTTADFKITVFFTTPHATVLDYAATTVRVPAGKEAQWTAAKKFEVPKDTTMLCVLRSVG